MIRHFNFTPQEIEGVFLITPFCAKDNRGMFIKDYSVDIFEQNNIQHNLKEVFYTYSHKGVIRAMHFQREKQQAKLVRCISGKIFDVVVDLRKISKTFGKWISFELSQKNQHEILIPEGCAHGYLVLENSVVSYKCAEVFYSEYDDGIMWDDPDLNIQWPLDLIGGREKLVISEKDRKLNSFMEYKMNGY
ncbi:dTDP-4-dehydrorhamnose 3,5-epimerase [Treponema putidum]|uniref:dTDP-4-dehydrorhamnose 3,5-epimerase n=1 Tax=Treponema putidum TaxID=221027 RepID=UPI0021050C25|nr:dTDP-4-dehydrorhamnose 3,5-epimerase [Treponema putidum]UTY30788.1 dTDP-4-dehydrorhamnose 3,5-epimerase [Treponema putidum]